VDAKTKHAVLRDGTRWEGSRDARLEQTAEGDLTLVRLPASAPDKAIDLPGSWEVSPSGLAVTASGLVCVAATDADQVLCLDPLCDSRTRISGRGFTRPRGLLIAADRLYVADAGSGEIRAFDLDEGTDLGALPGFRGPVTAMAVDRAGALRVKVDQGLRLASLDPVLGHAATGRLEAGPLDAGIDQAWERLAVEAAAPEGTAVRLQIHLASDTNAPFESDWLETRSLDTLLPPPVQDGEGQAPWARFLWLRVALTSLDRRTAPLLSQVHAVTTAPSYIDHLPAVYAREDGPYGFLHRWLALYRAELGDAETLLDDMPRQLDPMTAPADQLEWLADWLAFDLPGKDAPNWSVGWMRELILQAHDIHSRRGTGTGLREAIERHTGIRAEIQEAYRGRRIWQLDTHSRLGFDTGLAPARPDGAVVPDPCEPLVVGELVVAESRPQGLEDFGEPLFDDEAHLFSVLVPAGQVVGTSEREQLRAVIDAEKPAHTDYHLCLIEARMRVGFQARIGIDSIVAGPPEPLALDASRLGLDAFVGEICGARGSRVGMRSNIGQTTQVG